MEKDTSIRILIADDHPLIREGLVAAIRRTADMTVVGQASDGQEALDLFRTLSPDVTLLDLRMPGLDGGTTTELIREQFPAARIIILTGYDRDEDIYRCLRAGARAYFLKETPPQELFDAIRTVHAGRTCIPPDIAAKLAGRMSEAELTQRELQVLQFLTAGKSNNEIGTALFIGEGTVKTHVRNIFNKLDVSDRTQAVTVALKRGIVSLS